MEFNKLKGKILGKSPNNQIDDSTIEESEL